MLVVIRSTTGEDMERITPLIILFSNGGNMYREDSDAGDDHSAKVTDMIPQNTAEYAMLAGINPEALPPPSPFVRRKKLPCAVPAGPSFVQADVEPTVCTASFPHQPYAEFETVLEFLMSDHGQASEETILY
jgi:hypothetical protein